MTTNFSARLIGHIVLHSLFWIAVYFFYTYFLGYGSNNISYVNLFSLYLMPITVGIGYFFYFYLIPTYNTAQKQGYFLLYTLYTFVVSFFLIIISIFFGLIFSSNLLKENVIPLTKGVIFIIFGVYFVLVITIILGMIVQNYTANFKTEELKRRYLETKLQLKEQELRFLKMQIHPHFLFNTLNTLYGFALKKAEETPEMILKLSNLLDYILYQVEKPSVLLTDEVTHIENYIALEKMRFQKGLQMHITKNIANKNLCVAPMLLLPFVENAFKHGRQINNVLHIHISIESRDENIAFTIKNNAKKTKKEGNGIGLENIRKRLIMHYQNKHTLAIKRDENTFEVKLKINCNYA
ncbi:hypothetical protein BSU00_05030 [Tenacibaculum sp. SG-28]|nr:hypothetical protein BSU00_05030 [Tenacibaculum sp. SG-28]